MKWLFKYIKGTTDIGLIYEKKKGTKLGLEGFVDFDYAGNKDNRRSTTSYYLCLNECCTSWKTQLQPIMALSTTEIEYIAATEAIKEALWLQGLLQELKVLEERAIVYTDSQSSLHLLHHALRCDSRCQSPTCNHWRLPNWGTPPHSLQTGHQ
ncbi:hypothetical protein UlMin_022182 [Ulmus minor]